MAASEANKEAAPSTPEAVDQAEGLIFFPCSGGLHDSSSCSNVVFVVSRSRGFGAILCASWSHTHTYRQLHPRRGPKVLRLGVIWKQHERAAPSPVGVRRASHIYWGGIKH